ncbi:TetR/AcrR family transcriptional regulator [Pontibacter sp. G13]|uniref:TetR/AcrR family transcriptional regulator n=1 Tax=Pontibacter sp. G13 TaxID=3074898 RepID=UPI00288B3A6D|nr:TetR/AcrR family transcriptional regulator [Pontibacter sp. G13]WNJ20730.1 TetR/AcrR family transcriptional regulator [Pontibacter sp. G13]
MDKSAKPTTKRTRNKAQTMQLLLEAVGKVIREEGFQGIGVNAISKAAGVDKVLIYRYFGGLDGLLKAYTAQQDYWIQAQKKEDLKKLSFENIKEITTQLHIGALRHLWDNKELLELLKWELVERNDLTKAIAEEREENSKRMFQYFEKPLSESGLDLEALAAVLNGGIYYLTLHASEHPTYDTIDLSSEAGRKRIEDAVSFLIEMLMDRVKGQH